MRALQSQRRCPVCRIPCLLSLTNPPVNIVIQSMLQRQFPREYEERQGEMLIELEELQASRVMQEVPVLVLVDALYAPGMMLHLRLFEPRYIEMARIAIQSDRNFAILSVRQGDAYGLLGEIRDIGTEPHSRHTLLTVLLQKRFLCASLHLEGGPALSIANIDDRVFKGQGLYYCLPEIVVDVPDDEELGEQVLECKAFLRDSLKRLPPVTQRELRDTFTHEMDDSMNQIVQLAIPFAEAFKAIQSVHRAERVMLVYGWIQGRKPSPQALRSFAEHFTLSNVQSSVLFILALFACLLGAWVYRRA